MESRTTYKNHLDVCNYLLRIDPTLENHVFYVSTSLYKKYTQEDDMKKFCEENNLSVGCELHTDSHPVTMNYYDPLDDPIFWVSATQDEDGTITDVKVGLYDETRPLLSE